MTTVHDYREWHTTPRKALVLTYQTYETTQPWVVYTYLTTDKRTRITGRAKIKATCAVCGHEEVLVFKIPRTGPIPDQGRHPLRIKFLEQHIHPDDMPHPMAWAKPLLNLAAHQGGIDPDLLAMRLEADLNQEQP